MLLRSSSTPLLGSLLTSFSDSPNNNNAHFHDTTNPKRNSLNKLPHHHHHQTGSLNLTNVSCSSSPISLSIADCSDRSIKGFQRALSEGNLEGLNSAYVCCSNNDEQYKPSQPKKLPWRSKCLMLETIPSFSFYGLKDRYEVVEEDRDEEEEEEEYEKWNEVLDEEEVEIEQLGEIMAEEGSHYGLSKKMGNKVLSEQVKAMDRTSNAGYQEERVSISEEMYLARGLGIDGGINSGYGGGGSGSGGSRSPCGDGGDVIRTEEYYKRTLQENPGNPLFLRNYAQFLYQSKQDLPGAEEYYSRAILADPKDGEILSQYAKLMWQVHQDLDRASSYFECAAAASPEDRFVFLRCSSSTMSYIHSILSDSSNEPKYLLGSQVQAAYASFLWEVEEDEDECSMPHDLIAMPPGFNEEAMAPAHV